MISAIFNTDRVALISLRSSCLKALFYLLGRDLKFVGTHFTHTYSVGISSIKIQGG
jgi:hypothetical protein